MLSITVHYKHLLLQNLSNYMTEPKDAIRSLTMVQRRDELLHRVNNYRFRDWKDIKHDSDVYNGRLLHNRVGYTMEDQIPMFLGLRGEPWIGQLEQELLDKIPAMGIVESDLFADYPKG